MSKLPVFRIYTASRPSAPTTTPTFESCLSTFALESPRLPDSPSPVDDDPIVASPQPEVIDPITSQRKGSITHDRQKRRPTHEWNSLEEFHTWRLSEERDHGIELLLSRTSRSNSALWHEGRTYCCGRQGTGGKHNYVRKHMDRIRMRPNKRTGCGCRVIIKTYYHVSTVLGWYRAEHDHPTGAANLMFTRLQDSNRAYVLTLLRRQLSPKEVLKRVCRAYGEHERGHYITMADIYRLRKIVKQEEAARSASLSSDPPSYEHSEGSPIKEEDEDEEKTIPSEDASMTDLTQIDEDLDVSDEQSDGCADPGIPTSPPSGPAIPHVYTAGAEETTIRPDDASATDSAQVDENPDVSNEQSNGCIDPGLPTSPPSSSAIPDAYTTGAGTTMESAALPVASSTQVANNFASPLMPLPHSMPPPGYMPPPLVVYIPHPPYQMTLYPVYPVYFPPPTC